MVSMFPISAASRKPIGHLARLCKIPKRHNVIQTASIKRLVFKDDIGRPLPYPYWIKPCNPLHMAGDPLSMRYDDSSRLIIVDGPPAVGKEKLCKKIAEAFGLLYMPAPVHDELYIDSYGYDLRKLDPLLPPACRTYDLKQYLADPNHMQVPQFQLSYFTMRLEQYTTAMLHILATGQGVILNRSCLSDIGFVYAMYKAGYLEKGEVLDFEEMRTAALNLILKPHLAIYLDVPPEIVQKKIKQRGNPDEVNSKVFSTKYLSDLEKATKDRYLSLLEPHSEILIYNWSEEVDYNDVFEDIENLDLGYDSKSKKFCDWLFLTSSHITTRMEAYQNKVFILEQVTCTGNKNIAPRMWLKKEESDKLHEVYDNTPELKYSTSYNPYYGDKVAFRISENLQPWYYRRAPRDLQNYKIPEGLTKYSSINLFRTLLQSA